MKLPLISVVTLTYNPDLRIWKEVLISIQKQKYPKNRIEHIVMDGGSTNGAGRLAKQFGAKVYVMGSKQHNSEERKSLGIKKAKGDIIAFIESDNILPDKTWMRQMILPFTKDREIIGTYSAYNDCNASMPMLTRYCALFGVNDPVVYYLNKSEKLPRFKHVYDKGIMLAETKDYYKILFDRYTLPTLGDNGHMVRKNIIDKVNSDSKSFLHTDAFAQLNSMGYSTYGVVKNSIVHYIGNDIVKYLKRRVTFKKRFYDHQITSRKYLIFDKRSGKDTLNLLRYIVYSLTLVEPTMQSIRGYMAVPDIAWFLHPYMCMVTLFSYGISEFRKN